MTRLEAVRLLMLRGCLSEWTLAAGVRVCVCVCVRVCVCACVLVYPRVFVCVFVGG